VYLGDTGKPGIKPLRFGPRCRIARVPDRVVGWMQGQDELHFVSADAKVALRFRATNTGRWISARRDQALMLSRDLADMSPVASLTPAAWTTSRPASALNQQVGMAGQWRVFDDASGYVCTVNLTGLRVEGGFAIEWGPDCAGRHDGIRYWNESGSGLVLVGDGHVVLSRFVPAGKGKWRALGSSGVTLLR
jgi:hypothetical protein